MHSAGTDWRTVNTKARAISNFLFKENMRLCHRSSNKTYLAFVFSDKLAEDSFKSSYSHNKPKGDSRLLENKLH